MTVTQNDMNELFGSTIGPHATQIEPHMRRWVDNCRISSVGKTKLIKAISNPDGRLFIAKSMITPFSNNIEFLKKEFDSESRTAESVALSLEDIISDIEDFLSILPKTERFKEPPNELRRLLVNAADLRNSLVKYESLDSSDGD